MSWKSSYTDRAEDALARTREALRKRPSALASAEVLRAIDACGPSLARGMMTALDVNLTDVFSRASLVASARGSSLPLRRFSVQPATLDMIVRRAAEEASMLGHRLIGTEHVLLAMISVHDDPTTCALREAGMTQDTARGTLRRLLMSWTDDGVPKRHASVA